MAYVVGRPNGRFEIRESVHTPKGPRARSLANFTHLTEAILDRAGDRAIRPFDPELVRAAAERAGATTGGPTATRAGRPEMRRFVESSRRMARSLETRSAAGRPDPGDALIDLLGFAAQIKAFRPARPPEALRFPPLARLRAERSAPGPRR
jgi:hypothetical protein